MRKLSGARESGMMAAICADVAVLTIYVTGQTNAVYLVLAWGFVLARYVHSAIHCTSNNVMRRFYVFLASNAFLVTIWLCLAYQLITTI